MNETLESLEALGADKTLALPCNYVYRWIHQILFYFDLQHRHFHLDLFEPLNRIYNERLSPYDYREPCYRYLIAIATDNRIDMAEFASHLTAPKEDPAFVAHADGVLAETFRTIEARLADRLTATTTELERIRADQNAARAEINRLNSLITRLEQDNVSASFEIERLRSVIQNINAHNIPT